MTPRTGRQIVEHMRTRGKLSYESAIINKAGRTALNKEVTDGRATIEEIIPKGFIKPKLYYVPTEEHLIGETTNDAS